MNEARCSACANCGSGRFCKWLGAFLQPGLNNDPGCEGFTVQNTCPKTEHSALRHERQHILQALETKRKGSIVLEYTTCGKTNCRCSRGRRHGPYKYWHFYEAGKVKRRYLGGGFGDLLSKPVRELEDRLRPIDEILGQENRSSETSGGL